MDRIRSYTTLLGAAALIVAFDQWTKFLVRSNLEFGEFWIPIPELAPYLRIIHWNNTGAAFGLFPAGGQIFTIIAVLVSLAILVYFPRVPLQQGLLKVALSLELGGALGNLIDRLTLGTVTDFIAVAQIPVFNVADASITIGVVLLLAGMWLEERADVSAGASESTGVEETSTPGV